MTKVIRLAKIEGRLAIRSIDGILFGIAMPLGVLLLTTMIAGNNKKLAILLILFWTVALAPY